MTGSQAIRRRWTVSTTNRRNRKEKKKRRISINDINFSFSMCTRRSYEARKLISLEINKIVWFVTRKNDIKKSIINKLAIDCKGNYIQMHQHQAVASRQQRKRECGVNVCVCVYIMCELPLCIGNTKNDLIVRI